MVAILTRIFGIEHLNLAEDVVQEALARALQTWPYLRSSEKSLRLDHAGIAQPRVGRGPAAKSTFRAKQAEIARLMERDGVCTPDEQFSQKTKLATTVCG